MKKLVLLILACFCFFSLHAAYLKDVPRTLTQPDGSVLHCFASGDEYFNYLHDEKGYTIVQHPQTGFYVYADKRDGQLVATEFVAGRVDPASTNLQPFNLISPQEWMARRNARHENERGVFNRDGLPNHGTLNNISIFIRFADDDEFTNSYSSIDNMFNDESPDSVSMKTYFRAASYNALEISTYFYPGHSGETIISYKDIHPRGYFMPFNLFTNIIGYNGDEWRSRELGLIERAVNYINANYPVPADLNIDYNNDGYVDNVCLIVLGDVVVYPLSTSPIFWPHKWSVDDRTVIINGKQVGTYNFLLANPSNYDVFNTSTICHEMNHSLGAPDLYTRGLVDHWDLMGYHGTPPQHCGAYMKMKYGHWIDEIPEITQPGTYTLNPISSPIPTNIAYKILSDDPNQFYVLEYRDKTSETVLPGSGILIYRIDTRYEGNSFSGTEVNIFCPRLLDGPSAGGYVPDSANFSSDVGRTEFTASTNPYPCFSDGTPDNSFGIINITNAGSTISFSYVNTSNCEPPTNLVASVESIAVSLSWEAAYNAVSYNVYRDGSLIGNTTETSFIDDNTDFNTSYTYTVKSVNLIGLLSTSSEPTSVITPEGVFIGGENSQLICNGTTYLHNYLPSHSTSKYSFSEQIYTAEELGNAGFISSIAFYNEGAETERKYDIYLKYTTKNLFSNTTDWEIVSDYDKVFSGYVYMQANNWSVITFNTPFDYDGYTNVILAVDDNTGDQTPMIRCRTFLTDEDQAIFNYGSIDIDPNDPNYNPNGPAYMSRSFPSNRKNQLLITKTATNDYLPSYTHSNYSLSEQIFTAEELGDAGFITSVAFYNEGVETIRSYDIYLKPTLKNSFSNSSDWEIVSDSDMVFSGSVMMKANDWTYIAFDTPFAYDGNTKLVLVVNDLSGWHDSSPYASCRVFNTDDSQAIWDACLTRTDLLMFPNGFDPTNSLRAGTRLSVKNQMFITKVPFNIVFADANVKALCVANWDTDGDGELNYAEAAAVTSLENVFYGNSSITSFDELQYFIGLTSIGSLEFYDCHSLTSIEIPNSVTSIGEYAFYYCTGLTSMTVLADNPPVLGSNVFFRVNKTIPIYVPCGSLEAYQNVAGWSNFTNIMAMCSGEVSVTINPSEGGVVTGAGYYNSGEVCVLTATPNSGFSFGNWTENGVVVSTDTVYSFYAHPTTVVANFISNSPIVFADANVKALCVANWDTNGDGELSYEEAAAVTSLENVFRNNSTISSFDELQYFIRLTSVGSFAFCYCTSLTSIEIPNSVNSIGNAAFYDCSSLTSIEIPNTVTFIGHGAFTLCTGLTSMTVSADNPPALGNYVFSQVSKSIPVYVPCGSLEAYQSATGWNAFVNIQESCPQAQTIELVAGWNWFSTNLEITLDELKEALIEVAPGTNILIKSKTQNTVYNPVTNQWRGTLNTLDLTQMYLISVCTNCEIILTGTPINPTEHPITIQNGFNWIEFPLSENMSISNAFEGIVVNGDVIQSKTNNASYINGQWRGNFNTLEPGKGYIYKSNSSEPKTLVY